MLEARNRDGDTPLHLAARYRDPRRVVSLLTAADERLDYRPNKAGETPLYLVVVRGSDAAVVSEILKNCKSPAYGGPGGRTAMHAAVIDSSKDAILDKLLDWKQDLIKERDTKGWTSLHLAAHNGILEAVKKLLDKDKSVAYANNDEGNTALHVMNEILQKLPDCWEMSNSKGQTILHIAADVERDVATNFILKKPWVSRLINRKDNEGNTPLHVLASKGKAGLHMYPGADMLALNNETMTPLDILNREVTMSRHYIFKNFFFSFLYVFVVVVVIVEYMAEMEQRIESLLTQRLTTQFEQLQSKMFQYMESRGLEVRQGPDAVSEHRTVQESIKDDTSPMESSH
ncbi:hypothetical protein RHGRI_012159 [Rhododendron griersonianum]|uniref:Uncharacterized protein n=1 Tax=Rhododendron griersonianum TaxID=479676 RepID=A0AAV6KQS8_9ERIC|nr:hypothetical protein RHGRI_012159 [Rhododendron griersonianum]